MTAAMTHIKSAGHANKAPQLCVLIPYYKDNPEPLLRALLSQNTGGAVVEVLLYDDGTGDDDINAKMATIVKASQTPAHMIIAAQNKGRSAARNALKNNARADWVLFLDADMRPVTDNFLADYVRLIQSNIGDIIFGGFTVPKAAETAAQELHRALSEVSDCLPLQARQEAGPQFVASSNLCVRKSVLDLEDFDDGFVGWGWEDSEWAARVAKRFTLIHADIPALHLGLETTETLLRRFKTSGQNYVRFTEKHPDIATTLNLFQVCQSLRKIPGQKLMRPLLKSIVKLNLLPTGMRLTALKLWRASWYAEAFS